MSSPFVEAVARQLPAKSVGPSVNALTPVAMRARNGTVTVSGRILPFLSTVSVMLSTRGKLRCAKSPMRYVHPVLASV